MTFTWWSQPLDLFDHPYNDTIRNERAVEVPIANHWLRGRGCRGLELGNVLAHYGTSGHRVIDRYEQGAHIDNIDVFDADGEYRWIISISTVEHVRFDEEPRDLEAAVRVLGLLRSLLAPGGDLLVTVPLGHHPYLDRYLMTGADAQRVCTFVRCGDGWQQTNRLTWKPYGATTPWAESVWIGEWKG